MIEYKGKYNIAYVMNNEIDPETSTQIYSFLNHPAFQDSYIAIMPDCHAGAGACIGLTMSMNEYVIPNIVGVDIGCGVSTYRIDSRIIALEGLDRFIRENIPAGFKHRKTGSETKSLLESSYLSSLGATVTLINDSLERVLLQLGTLGGGNHFIELGKTEEEELCLTIHTGSRNFGLKVANFHQNKAKELMQKMFIGKDVYKGLEFLPLDLGGEEYIRDMEVAQTFAMFNRKLIAKTIIERFFEQSFEETQYYESIHNYIGADKIIRKGAVSSYVHDIVLLPFNMRDGIAICRGKSNRQWNFSAPHGAGRILSRSQAKREISLEEYGKSMEGIYSTSVNEATLDEAPMAYKEMSTILDLVRPTVDLLFLVKPIYNFKAGL